MNIVFCQNKKFQSDGNKMLTESLNRIGGTEITVVCLESLSTKINDGKITFDFGNYILDENSKIDLLIIRGGIRDVKIARRLSLFCKENNIKFFDNNLYEVGYLIDKKTDSFNFAVAKLPAPKTQFISQIEDIEKLDLGFPLIMKPTNTGTGFNVYKVNDLNEIEQIIKDKESNLSKIMFQEFIDYKQDIRLVVVNNEVVGAMRRIPKAGEFRANFSIGGDVESFEAPEEMKRLAVAAAKSCKAEISGVDILVDAEGKYFVLEANRTPGLSGISKALNKNIADVLAGYILKCKI